MTPFQPTGFRPVYRPGEANHCPGCSGRAWLVGRLLAQCARCATAIPLAGSDIGRAA